MSLNLLGTEPWTGFVQPIPETSHSADVCSCSDRSHSLLALGHSYKHHKYSPASLYVGVAFLLEKGWLEVHTNRKHRKFMHTEHLREDKAGMEMWRSRWRCDRLPHQEGDGLVKTWRQQWDLWDLYAYAMSRSSSLCVRDWTGSGRLRPLERPWCQKESEGLFARKAARVFLCQEGSNSWQSEAWKSPGMRCHDSSPCLQFGINKCQ